MINPVVDLVMRGILINSRIDLTFDEAIIGVNQGFIARRASWYWNDWKHMFWQRHEVTKPTAQMPELMFRFSPQMKAVPFDTDKAAKAGDLVAKDWYLSTFDEHRHVAPRTEKHWRVCMPNALALHDDDRASFHNRYDPDPGREDR